MTEVTIKQLLEAGVHFGHQTQRWNPKMKKFIFGERNGIYIINLEITLDCLKKAMEFLRSIAAAGSDVLLVGTKKQAQIPIREGAEACEMPYVDQRWLGGMLTNFETIRKSIHRLDEIDKMEADGSFAFMKKKEAQMLSHERDKLSKNLKGIRRMRKLPGALFVIDSKKEDIAVKEAAKLGIPVVAVIDTNCDPDVIQYPIPGNDDAIRAVKLFCQVVAETLKDGRGEYKKLKVAEETKAAEDAKAAETGSETAADELADDKEEVLAEAFSVEEPAAEETGKAKPKKTIRKTK